MCQELERKIIFTHFWIVNLWILSKMTTPAYGNYYKFSNSWSVPSRNLCGIQKRNIFFQTFTGQIANGMNRQQQYFKTWEANV